MLCVSDGPGHSQVMNYENWTSPSQPFINSTEVAYRVSRSALHGKARAKIVSEMRKELPSDKHGVIVLMVL